MQALPPIQRLSPSVIRILGLNPGPFTLQGTNTYLIGNSKYRILLDTGEGKSEYLPLLDSILKQEKCEISKIVLTHYHHDHVGGVKGILEYFKGKEIQVLKKIDKEKDEGIMEYLTEIGKEVKVEGVTLKTIDTPGHTEDHQCFYFLEEKNLFSGDCVLGNGTTIFTDLAKYLNSLEKLLNMEDRINSIYPAHGEFVEDGREKIQEYIEHRIERENQIIEILKGEVNSVKPIKVNGKYAYFGYDIVKFLYKSYPKEVYLPAFKLINLHLQKLLGENKVEKIIVDKPEDELYSIGWKWVN
ncbi:lactamase, beta 2 [Neoconidiobolus thromboides FSU 785]|nr:lactamase, beta 2 [Neoconidiobolus thromboides FSU 785]